MSNTTEDDGIKPPKVTGSPERIWLNYGDLERHDTHDECYRNGEVTWCQDSVFDSDVEYVRADAQAATIAEQAPTYRSKNAQRPEQRQKLRELDERRGY